MKWTGCLRQIFVLGPSGKTDAGGRVASILYYSSSSIYCQLIRLMGVLVTTLLIPAKDFGIYASGLMIIGLCNMLRDLGQDSGLMSLPVLGWPYIRLHFVVSCSLGLVSCFALSGSIWLTPWFIDLRSYYLFLVSLILFEASYHTPQIVAQRRFRFREMAVVEALAGTVWLTGTFMISVWLRDVRALLVASCLESFTRWIGLLYLEPGCLKSTRIPRSVFAYFVRYAKILTAQSWVQHFSEQLDVLLLRYLAGPTELGNYSRLRQIIGISFSLSVRSVDRVASANYSAEQQHEGLLRRSLAQFLILMLSGAITALTGIYFFVVVIGKHWFGAEWSSGLMQLWLWAIPFCLIRPIMWNFNVLFQSTGRPRLLLLSVIANSLFLIFLSALLVPVFGARGLLSALTTSTLATLILQSLWSSELHPFRKRTRFGQLLGIPN
ncbi:MAG: oligosaccharide flippase family protein [Verrucomicrobia bacterium]|nr:oligosaccharide flippase family protein [Verrucomicrobiota bacterium]